MSLCLPLKSERPGQRHILRDRRPSTGACPAACPSSLCDGEKRNEIVVGEEKYSLYCADYRSQGWTKNVLFRHDKPNQGRTPFVCTLWFPIHLNFNSQHGPPRSSLSGLSFCERRYICSFKGSLTRHFRLQFFSWITVVSPWPLSIPLGSFWLLSKIAEIIAN